MKPSLLSHAYLWIALGLISLGPMGTAISRAQSGAGKSFLMAQSAQSKPPGGGPLGPNPSKPSNLAGIEEHDENDVYRHSASVRAVGRLLHLDPEQAARSFEYFNFAILAGTILFFLFKKMPGIFRERSERIQKQLAEARTATEKANARLQAVERKFAGLDREIEAIRTQAEQEGAAEEAHIKALMERERQRIVASAEQEIAAAAAAAKRDLKHFAAQLAIERAAQMISLSDQEDRMLLRHFVHSPGIETGNGGRH